MDICAPKADSTSWTRFGHSEAQAQRCNHCTSRQCKTLTCTTRCAGSAESCAQTVRQTAITRANSPDCSKSFDF
eukprot:12990-Heterococcus_DN1.PRE.1